MGFSLRSALLGTRPARLYQGAYASARTEIAFYHRPYRVGGFHNIFQHAVNDVLLEDAQIAVAGEIFLKRLQFEAALAREGVAGRMNPEFYQRPPAEGEVVMGDVM